MTFPIVLEHNRFLNQIHHLEAREREAQEKLECIRAERNHLVDCIRLGMGTSGNKMLDFVLVACGGIHDREVEKEYRAFEENVAWAASSANRGPKTIVTVQTAHHATTGDVTFIRCVHVATLSYRKIEYQPYSLLMDIPVESGVYVWSEIWNERTKVVRAQDGLRDTTWLSVGPLRNKRYSHAPRARNSASSAHQYIVPYEACSMYTLYPCDRKRLGDLDLDVELMTECMRRWTALRAQYTRRT